MSGAVDQTPLPNDVSDVPKGIEKSELWMDGGNVILQAEVIQFQVHRSVLSNHSMVFRDMFSSVSPPSEPQVNGLSLVPVSDTASDIHHMVKAMYDRK